MSTPLPWMLPTLQTPTGNLVAAYDKFPRPLIHHQHLAAALSKDLTESILVFQVPVVSHQQTFSSIEFLLPGRVPTTQE